MEISTLSIPRHAYRVCAPRTRLYHRIKTYLIRTTFAHDTGSAAGERGEGPVGSPRALGSQLQLGLLRGPPPPSSSIAVARGRDGLAPRAEPHGDLSGALAQQRVACAVEGAVILLRGDARRRRPRRHNSKPSTVPVWCREALQASFHRPGAAPRVLSAAPPPIAPAFCTRSPRRRRALQGCRAVGGRRVSGQAARLISTGRTLNHCDMHAATVTCMQPCAYDHETSQQRSVLI